MVESGQLSFLRRGSLRFLILLVVLAYFGIGCYWLSVTARWSYAMIVDLPHYQELIKETWWLATFYSSELGLSVGIVLRWIAGIFALYSAILFLKGGEASLPQIKGKAGAALLFEGGYYLTYIPSVILGFVYPLAEKWHLWYFEPAPPWLIVFLVCGLAVLPMVAVIAPSIFKLRSKIVHSAPSQEIIKWSCITGLAYLFLMFWLNYSLTWAASLVYWPERAQPGISVLYDPLNLAGFLITIVGLFAIATFGLKVALPAIKGKPVEVNLKNLGYVMLAFGCYFIVIIILYLLIGGYHVRPTVFMELLGPLHNPDLWCASFILPGIYLAAKYGK